MVFVAAARAVEEENIANTTEAITVGKEVGEAAAAGNEDNEKIAKWAAVIGAVTGSISISLKLLENKWPKNTLSGLGAYGFGFSALATMANLTALIEDATDDSKSGWDVLIDTINVLASGTQTAAIAVAAGTATVPGVGALAVSPATIELAADLEAISVALQLLGAALKAADWVSSWVAGKIADAVTGTTPSEISSYVQTGAVKGPDPILLDLSADGNGITLTGQPSGNAYFDYNENGFAESTGWADGETGVLVFSPSLITSADGNPILVDGFQQLQSLAGSGITTLTAANPVWNMLMIWVGGNGLPGSGTYETLGQAGIASINLAYASTAQSDSSGATETAASTFTMVDGSVRDIGDFSFWVDPTNTLETDVLPVAQNVAALPEILASGTVYDLSQAMVRDDTLAGLVQQFISSPAISDADTLVTKIIQEWTGANQVTQNSVTDFMDARELYVVEQFRGAEFTAANIAAMNSQSSGGAAQTITSQYNGLYGFVFGALVAQGSLSTLWDGAPFNMAAGQKPNNPDFAVATAFFDNLLVTDSGTAANDLALFGQALKGLGLTTAPGYSDFKSAILAQAPDLGQVLAAFDGTGSTPIEMGVDTASTILSGANTGGFLFGFSGNDSFKSSGGNVLEDFGTGGNDTYEVSNGDVIKDGTGLGSVWFNGDKLTGGQWNSTTTQFESPDFDYKVINGNSLQVTSVADPSQSITIDNVPLTQNADGSYSLSGEYLGIQLDSTPNTGDSVVTYDVTSDTWVGGYIHNMDNPIDPSEIILWTGPHYDIKFDNLNPGDVRIQALTSYYVPGWYATDVSSDYQFVLTGPTQYYPNGGQEILRLIDADDGAADAPILDTITFADGETFTLGQLLGMPQVGLPTDPTVQVTGSQATIAQAGINATYQVGVLSSNVELTGFESTAASTDQLSFTSAVSSANLLFSQSGTDLLVTNLLTGAVLQVDNYLSSNTDPSVTKSIQFGEGTSLTYEALTGQLASGATSPIISGADLLQLTSTYENGDGTYLMDLSGAEAYLDNLIATDDPSALTLLAQFTQALQPLKQAGLVNFQAFREHYVGEGQQYGWVLDTGSTSFPDPSQQYTLQYDPNGGWAPSLSGNVWLSNSPGNSVVVQAYGPLTLYGNASGEFIEDGGSGFPLTVVASSGGMSFNASSNSGTTTFDGGTGDDSFTGGSGANFFGAHGGNDVDNGGHGANTYYLAAGFGSVVINNMCHSSQTLGNDVIEFDSSLTEDNVSFTQVGDDLVINDDYGDQALVQGYFSDPDSYGNVQTVGAITFSDGVTLTPSDIAEWANVSTQTSSSIISAPADDPGSTLTAWGIGSTLVGGSGADSLIGGAGGDTFVAGTGDDYMSGKEGTNTYVFGANIGNDVIDNSSALGFGTNILQFTDGITADQLSFSRSASDLVICIEGLPGRITVKQFFDDSVVMNSSPLISEIVFGDGSTWSSQQLFARLEVASSQQPEAWGLDTISGAGWQSQVISTVTATGGDVALYGGDGYANTIDGGSA